MTKDEINGWLIHPVTEKHIDRLKEAKEEIKENWARGDYTTESIEGTIQKNSEALGSVGMIDQILIDLEDMEADDEL